MNHIRRLRSFRLHFACGRQIQLKASSADAAALCGSAVTGRPQEHITKIREMTPVVSGVATPQGH